MKLAAVLGSVFFVLSCAYGEVPLKTIGGNYRNFLTMDAKTETRNQPQPKPCSDWKAFLSSDYLCWWWKQDPQPVTLGVTTGNDGLYPSTYPQVGQPGISVILGGKDVGLGAHQGFRVSGATLCNDRCGVGGRYFQLLQNSKSRGFSSDGLTGSDSIYVPFHNTNPASPLPTNESAWAFPGVSAANLSFDIANSLKGVQAYFLGRCYCSESIELFALGGFAWLELKDRLRFKTNYHSMSLTEEKGITKDQFSADNNFYGGSVGLDAAFTWNWFWLDLAGKVSLGEMRSTLNINGVFKTNDFNGETGPLISYPGGVFALPSNIGVTNHNWFAVIPEAELTLGFQLLKQWNLEIGYSFMYVNKVLWAGNGMDGNINPENGYVWEDNDIPTFEGPADPSPRHKGDSFWAQGLHAGLAFVF